MTVRRIKAYSAETGYVYQYYLEEQRSAQKRKGQNGNEYVFIASRDRKTTYPVPVFLRRQAVDAWTRAHGRALTGAEQYAAVKMRLFRFFDEAEDWEAERLKVEVTPENIDQLLAILDIR